MSEHREEFHVMYALGHGIEPTTLSFGGAPTDAARPAIVRALRAAGRGADGDGTDLKLSPVDVLDERSEAWETQFLMLTGEETLQDLRLMIGPDDSRALLRQGSWGGGDGPEFFRWLVEDFYPFAGGILEAYGALEVMRTVGRAIEAKRHRESREEAELWVRSGLGEVHGLLRNRVFQFHAWPVAELRKYFGLNDGDAGRLMKACGYDYDPATQTYYWLEGHSVLGLSAES